MLPHRRLPSQIDLSSRPVRSKPARSKPARQTRRGAFLIIVLVVISVASLAVYSFTDIMVSHDEAADLAGRQIQARRLAESGVEMLRVYLMQTPVDREMAGGDFNNPAIFQAVTVVEDLDSNRRGNFSIVAAAYDETGQSAGVRFGLQDESAKLNVNVLPILDASSVAADVMSAAGGTGSSGTTAPSGGSGGSSSSGSDEEVAYPPAVGLLMELPGMTEDVADAILDWLDADEEVRPLGCEAEYYGTLLTPYAPKNGPVDSIEELLLVRGVTPQLMFGADLNRNGLIDAGEQANAALYGGGASALGWASMLTAYSAEANTSEDGLARVDINQEDLELLKEELLAVLGNEEWASFIVAYRVAGKPGVATTQVTGAQEQLGILPSSPGELWDSKVLEDMDLSAGGQVQFNQLLDLVNATVTVTKNNREVIYASPFAELPIATALYMPTLMQYLTAQTAETIPGRLNINQCPPELIWGLPGIDEEAKQAILDARGDGSESENRRFETWPLVEGLISLDQMRQLSPLICAGGDVFRAQIVGYFEGSNTSSRIEVVIDATSATPRQVMWRDLTHLGRGFDVATLGIRSVDGLQELREDGE